MAGTVGVKVDVPANHLALSYNFFTDWQERNESRRARWDVDTLFNPFEVSTSHTHLAKLHLKLQRLKAEIANLVAQDTSLFRQLFALHKAILEFHEQLEASESECSSVDTSPCSTLSSSGSVDSCDVHRKGTLSFVRQHVSYPPIARNRSHRIKSTAPQHVCQDSYDSGIHTSDHEIFV